ncbi:hypothetical protein SteCoe_22111 [Stentor coeruleus]|uniref:Uncharacterized protein n=1 Tax=Stentor coeruleus TaxID=5963 RepID=A0A1R2BMU2_9CILI|nr:hypothetical protein SteCoe_22111 [Stentor coeruleus]
MSCSSSLHTDSDFEDSSEDPRYYPQRNALSNSSSFSLESLYQGFPVEEKQYHRSEKIRSFNTMLNTQFSKALDEYRNTSKALIDSSGHRRRGGILLPLITTETKDSMENVLIASFGEVEEGTTKHKALVKSLSDLKLLKAEFEKSKALLEHFVQEIDIAEIERSKLKNEIIEVTNKIGRAVGKKVDKTENCSCVIA